MNLIGKNLFLYNYSNKYFYEDIGKKENSCEFYNIVNEILPRAWSIKKMSIYFSCMNDFESIPDQGWKIHVSANLKNAEEILKIVTEIARDNYISFKFMKDKEMLKLASQKPYPRGGSGKFMTIYPKDTDEFLRLLDILYEKLKYFEGPYILSDNRYKDCKVIYYRYGGLKGKFRVDRNGEYIPVILDTNGQWIDDTRTPYFKIPINISDPVKQKIENDNKSYIKENYLIKKPLYFSNSGGIYEAIKLETKEKVIIKEARPYTCMAAEEKDSIYFRKSEFKVLKKLEKYNVAPKPIELFKEWEHIFLVEEFIEGISLHNFCAQNNPFYKAFSINDHIATFIDKMLEIFSKIVDVLIIFHSNGLIVSDLAPKNILIKDNLCVKFIDLEACLEKNNADIHQLSTYGFSEKINESNLEESDLYALGCIFLSCLLRRNEIVNIAPNVIKESLNSLFKDYSLPLDLKQIIFDLIDNEPSKRPKLNEVKARLDEIKKQKYYGVKLKNDTNYDKLNFEYEQLISKCVDSIDKVATIDRVDRLFPNTPLINNSLNITCGALGNLHTFKLLKHEDKIDKYKSWIINKLNKKELYAPGLYVGVAGIAWVLLEIGETEKAMEILNSSEKNKLFKNNYGMQTGLSGYGMTLIKFWLETNITEYLNKAKVIGDELMYKCKISNFDKTAYWPDDIECHSIGYGNGTTGISLFLLYLFLATKNKNYLDIGESALKHDLLQKIKVENNDFYAFPSNNENTGIIYPYFMVGSAGIVSVLVRYYKTTKDNYYLEEIKKIVPGIHIKYALNPGLFNGLAGLGNALLDCYNFLNDNSFLKMAYDVAEGINLFKVDYNGGILFPDDYITKLSTDFGSGTSGIILFLNRLINNNMNFCFFLDELFE